MQHLYLFHQILKCIFVTIVSTITGIITGQLVDYFKLEEKLGLKTVENQINMI